MSRQQAQQHSSIKRKRYNRNNGRKLLNRDLVSFGHCILLECLGMPSGSPRNLSHTLTHSEGIQYKINRLTVKFKTEMC